MPSIPQTFKTNTKCLPLPLSAGELDSGWQNNWVERMTRHSLDLPETKSRALSRLVPALLCGEQSAVCIFTAQAQYADTIREKESARVLRQIALEELHHEHALELLMYKLPRASDVRKIQTRSKRFYMSIGRKSSRAIHFYQIALLDSVVSIIMHRVENSCLQDDALIRELFCRIKKDEARHSLIGKHYAEKLGMSATDKDQECHRIHSGLSQLLLPLSDAFEEIGVDTQNMWQRIDRRFLL